MSKSFGKCSVFKEILGPVVGALLDTVVGLLLVPIMLPIFIVKTMWEYDIWKILIIITVVGIVISFIMSGSK